MKPEEDPVISTEQLADRMRRDGVVVLDCRFDLLDPAAGARSWRHSHIPGAVHADLDEVLSGPPTADSGRHPLPDPQVFAAWAGSCGIGNDSTVVVYDAGPGAVAARAWWLLRWVGHEDVHVLDGGFNAWQAEGRPLEYGDSPAPDAREFVPKVREGAVTTSDDIIAGLPGMLLVDAREARRFRGEFEPIDSVAGHIPGSRNLPYTANLDEDGKWKAPAALGEIYAPLLAAAPGGDWVVMCGSGVTACHLAIGALRAGEAVPRLYAGSWSEWIKNPERPVKRLP